MSLSRLQTYDSVFKVHGMVLASSPGHFSSPTCQLRTRLICSSSIAPAERCRDGAMPTCMLTIAFMHHPYLVCIRLDLVHKIKIEKPKSDKKQKAQDCTSCYLYQGVQYCIYCTSAPSLHRESTDPLILTRSSWVSVWRFGLK